MILNAVILLLTALANFALAFFVYRRHTRSSINQSFSVFAINVALWTVAALMASIARTDLGAFFWVRMSFILSAFLPATFYFFVSVFPEGKPIKPGDLLVIASAGAYCFSMSSNYNSRPRSCEVMVDGKKGVIIRKREDYSDLWRCET